MITKKKITEKKPVVKKPKKKAVVSAEAKKELKQEKVVKVEPIEVEANVKKMKKETYLYAVGRRKTAMAKVRGYSEGKGITVNTKNLPVYFGTAELQKIVLSPLNALGVESKLSWKINVAGGGTHAQAEAVRHGISQALVKRNEEDRPLLKKAGFLTRDPRVKERKKPGLKRARRAPQWAKR